MDKHVAERWVQALRSGQYQQGQHELHPDTNSYCCLGVLCDLYRVEQGKGEWRKGPMRGENNIFTVDDEEGYESSVLPESVKDWAGMHSSVGEIVGTVDALAALNDEGMEFPQLADLIEKKWEVL
jgi:hypothetical protein